MGKILRFDHSNETSSAILCIICVIILTKITFLIAAQKLGPVLSSLNMLRVYKYLLHWYKSNWSLRYVSSACCYTVCILLARNVVLKITYCNYNSLDSVILHELVESFSLPSLFSSDFLLMNFINARKLSSKRNRTNKGKIPSRFCHNVHKFTEKMRW